MLKQKTDIENYNRKLRLPFTVLLFLKAVNTEFSREFSSG